MATRAFIRDFFTRECLKKRCFLEKADAQNLQNFVQAPAQLEFLLVHWQVLSTVGRGKDYAFFPGKVEIDADNKPS